MSIVYLNGTYLPAEQAQVSVMDRGFLFGDGVYEVIPVYGGRLFRLREHLERLAHSLTSISLKNPLDQTQWQSVLSGLVEKNSGGDQSVYLQVTRGVSPKRDHVFPAGIEATIFAMSSPLTPPSTASCRKGVAAITLQDIRWQYCDIKAITLLPNVLMRQQAIEQGAAEAILLRDGALTEGAASNIFIVAGNELLTTPKSNRILPGITRDLILDLAARHQITCREAIISEPQLRAADEIWMTSSTKEILPVTKLDGVPIGAGECGSLCARMQSIYRDYVDGLRNGVDALA